MAPHFVLSPDASSATVPYNAIAVPLGMITEVIIVRQHLTALQENELKCKSVHSLRLLNYSQADSRSSSVHISFFCCARDQADSQSSPVHFCFLLCARNQADSRSGPVLFTSSEFRPTRTAISLRPSHRSSGPPRPFLL